MYMPTPYATKPAGNKANAYARIGLETSVMSASPHQLVAMLLDGAKAAICMARYHMTNGDIPAKGLAITKAINIVGHGLKGGLDTTPDDSPAGKMVVTLTALYDHIVRCLLNANIRNDPTLLDEAERLIDSRAEVWRKLGSLTQQQGMQSPSAAI